MSRCLGAAVAANPGLAMDPWPYPEWKPPVGVEVDRGHPHNVGCLNWWPMWENGGTTANDVLGIRTGTLTNFPAGTEWSTGRDGCAPLFDGVDSYISINALMTITISAGATFTWRSRRSTTNTDDAVFGRLTGGTTTRRTIRFVGAASELRIYTDTS